MYFKNPNHRYSLKFEFIVNISSYILTKYSYPKCPILASCLCFSMSGILEFIDTADMTVMTQACEHFMATDVEWDPTGRYVTTGVSWWGHKVTVPSGGKHLTDTTQHVRYNTSGL